MSFFVHARKPPTHVLATVRKFPNLQPLRLQPVPAEQLAAPLRKDILWRAVVFEGDAARVGSGNSPTRSTVGYSTRKLRPQKGSGRARLGDAGSPMLHGGGRSHGAQAPNDFSTKLPRKIYAQAVRVSLSHLYQNGTLSVVERGAFKHSPALSTPQAVNSFLSHHDLLGKHVVFIQSRPVTDLERQIMQEGSNGRAHRLDCTEVDVRTLLKARKVIVESPVINLLAGNPHEERTDVIDREVIASRGE
ncbi:hypothetical protein CANCADRAFT_32906 [Tortispora caseinolytica NRRL Y-17796]|uniref:Large ribosomal subunit protein uL4m n=1 Tax=Tortispora caseinolytica NRRL Y-17796 TaxID=767744 RepID=A0A1E4TDG2_9ASCO|nr:hypothetical protein CANCADRAFT_32906 [Tortispora caseinolytica NRRL Y-17796]